MLEINEICKKYDQNVVLDKVSLKVEKGDIFGVLGLSGAGKSTLIRCINGLEIPDSGEIIFQGKVISSNQTKISREDLSHISMIFQSFNLLDQKTVLENVQLALEFSNKVKKYDKNQVKEVVKKYRFLIKQEKDKSKIKLLKEEMKFQKSKIIYQDAFEALEKVNLIDKWNSYPSSLSGGQKQRVAIARSLMTNPDILLCDEATSALDPETTTNILEILKELNAKFNLTIVLISHQMNVVESICNKVAIIDHSKIVEVGLLSDIFLNPQSDIAKKLIYSNRLNTKLSNKNLLRIVFDGNIDEPLIANIVQVCSILISIVHADSKVIDNKVYGQMVIKLPKKENERIKLKKYLTLKKVKFEEVNSDEY